MKNDSWISREEEKLRLKFLDDWKKFEQRFYWGDEVLGNVNYIKKNKMEKEIKLNDCSIQKLSASPSYLIMISDVKHWVTYDQLMSLKKVLSKIK